MRRAMHAEKTGAALAAVLALAAGSTAALADGHGHGHGVGTGASGGRGAAVVTPEQRERVEGLINRMTVREKAGQMTQIALHAISSQTSDEEGQEHVLDEALAREVIVDAAVGSLLNTAFVALDFDYWRGLVERVQTIAVEETRLGIPLIYGVDSVHGANYINGATIFPHNLTLAATFEPELSRVSAEITAAETRAAGLPWNFSPVFDVARHPAWSRVFETFGEDPYLCGVMAAASVEGQQGDDLSAATAVAATGKHFLGYGAPHRGRDRTPAYISDVELREICGEPFEHGFDVGLRSVMVNSAEVNGVPVHASRPILTDLLRHEMGYGGVVLTDWRDVLKLHDWHRAAQDEREATLMAVSAGIDMAMTPESTSFVDQLTSLVEDGLISESRLDESVRRILDLKMELGLFEEPMPAASAIVEIGTEEAAAESLRAAERGITLLRNNDGVLPLAEGTKILVTGPTADDVVPLHGSWTYSWQGTANSLYPDTPTVLDAVRERFGEANVTYAQGVSLDEAVDIDAAAEAAEDADVVLLCVGARPSVEKPGDITDLALPGPQVELARALAATGKPVILTLIVNRPRLLNAFESEMDAVIWTGHPGPHGPEALASILSGDVNPSGKLPFTYPRAAHELLTYDHKYSESISPNESDRDGYNPLFAFGEGMSYTTFAYSGLEVAAPSSVGEDDEIEVAVTVRNTGDRAGAETVLLYVTDTYATVTPRVRRLRDFTKIDLAPGESRRVTFTLGHEDLAMFNADLERVVEPGEFVIHVGDQSQAFTVSGS